MHARRRAGRVGLALLLLAGAGCPGKPALRPGVTFDATVISPDGEGKAVPQGPPSRVESAVTLDKHQVGPEGSPLTLQVRKTEFGQATFEVTFPDKTTQTVRVKNGHAKDVLPEGQKLGVRIRVEESR
jgi:hypothetical protein